MTGIPMPVTDIISQGQTSFPQELNLQRKCSKINPETTFSKILISLTLTVNSIE
jgi:hypothetical protein